MENNQNNPTNRTTQSGNSSNMQASSGRSQMSGSSQSSRNSGNMTGSAGSNAMQGRSSQQATTGQGGMKNIQDKLQQFGNTAMQRVNSMSTTQKVIGGSLLALGAGWLAMGSKNKANIKNKVSSLASKKSKTNKGTSGSPNIGTR